MSGVGIGLVSGVGVGVCFALLWFGVWFALLCFAGTMFGCGFGFICGGTWKVESGLVVLDLTLTLVIVLGLDLGLGLGPGGVYGGSCCSGSRSGSCEKWCGFVGLILMLLLL